MLHYITKVVQLVQVALLLTSNVRGYGTCSLSYM